VAKGFKISGVVGGRLEDGYFICQTGLRSGSGTPKLALPARRDNEKTLPVADRGIDGRLYFRDGMPGDKTRQIILSVKAGHVTASQVRDLVGVIDREKAAIGVLISFEKPTKPMEREAASAGVFETAWGPHPRVQLLTVGELLERKQINAPRTAGANVTYKAAPKVAAPVHHQHDAFDTE
jgi:site-specific DNA-methyltransferase (adenine-specific)